MTTILAMIVIFTVAPGLEGSGFEAFGIFALFAVAAIYDIILWGMVFHEEDEDEEEK